MIITLDGTPGSGKDTIGKKFAEKYHLKFYSIGHLWREIARRKGISTEDLGKEANKNSTIDRDLDTYQEELGKEEDNFIITGRTSFHFIPHAIHVFLKVDYQEAAKRIFPDLKKSNERNEKNYATEQDLAVAIKERNEGENKRYKKYYQLDVNNAHNYDLVLDTTHLTQNQVYAIVEAFVAAYKKT